MSCTASHLTCAYAAIRSVFVAAILIGSAACTDKTNSSVSVTADYLEVHGSVFNGPGNGMEGVNIFIIGLDEPLTQSGVGGEFRFTISDNQLYQATAQEKSRLGEQKPATFNLLFDLPGEPRLMGISRPIRYDERGSLEIGDVNIGLAASVSGKVTRLHGDGDFTPEAGVKVWIAGKETLTTEEGHFAFSELPAGSLQAYMLRKDHPAVATELVLGPGEELVLPYPLVILPSDEVTGWLSPLPAPDPAGLVAQSHPYRRSFKVHASPLAKFIRYHHDEESFALGAGDATAVQGWLPVRDKIHYDFPNDGTHRLFFQFADANQQTLSDVRILSATTDIFQDTSGMIIGDGSGIITSRVVTLQVDVPAAATEMRFAEIPEAFSSNLPWLKAQSVQEYVFLLPAITNSTADLRELYVQFRRGGEGSEESLLYRASARLQPFAGLTNDIFQIHDGSGSSQQRVVDITIDLPPNAWEMRIFPEQVVGSTFVGGIVLPNAIRQDVERNFIRAQPQISFVFFSPGRKNIFFQMRDQDGLVSPIYSKEFFVLPFLADGPGFTINQDAPLSISRDVTLEFLPPPGAIAFRVAETEEAMLKSMFQVIKNFHPMRLSQTGLRTVYVQFQDYDGMSSFVYSKSIVIDPFNGDPGDIILNAGSAITIFPSLDIDIIPPLAARDMRITLKKNSQVCGGSGGSSIDRFGQISSSSEGGYIPLDVYAEALLDGPGAYMVCAQFRTYEGDESSYVSRSIIYDPFPDGIGGIVIEDGDLTTDSRLVDLDIVLPPAAHKMRIASDIYTLEDTPFTPVSPTTEFLLPNCPGNEESCPFQVLVQFQTVDGIIGPTFHDHIILDQRLFDPAKLKAEINNGDLTTSNPTLSIALITPPEAAMGVQISESLNGFSGPSQTINASMIYTLNDVTPGEKTIYLRYEAANGDMSTVFSETIELVP